MRCWRAAISRWETTVPVPTLPAGSRIDSTRNPVNVSAGCAAANQPDHAVLFTPGTANRRNKKRAARCGPLLCRNLAARQSRTQAIERRRRRVVVGDVGAIAEAVPDRRAVDDATRANLADDHDPMADRHDAQHGIAGAGSEALAYGLGRVIGMPGPWRRLAGRRIRDRLNHRTDEVDVARRAHGALPIPQVVGPVVFFNGRVARRVDGHYIRNVAAPPGTGLPAVPDGHCTNGRMAVDHIADRCRG